MFYSKCSIHIIVRSAGQGQDDEVIAGVVGFEVTAVELCNSAAALLIVLIVL